MPRQVLENKEFEQNEFLEKRQLRVVFENKFATFCTEFATFCKITLQIQNRTFK